jgi:hypothetical protein
MDALWMRFANTFMISKALAGRLQPGKGTCSQVRDMIGSALSTAVDEESRWLGAIASTRFSDKCRMHERCMKARQTGRWPRKLQPGSAAPTKAQHRPR